MTTTRLAHIDPDGVQTASGYTHVVSGYGRLIAISGQIATDENGDLVGAGDAEAQARQVFENLRRCLVAAGVGFRDVIKLTYYVTDAAYLPAVREVRDSHFGSARKPASTAVQVAALARPDLMMEIEAWALGAEVRG
jgi:enamine deaminase RidA (YjgF/YER057c/UK114 family)